MLRAPLSRILVIAPFFNITFPLVLRFLAVRGIICFHLIAQLLVRLPRFSARSRIVYCLCVGLFGDLEGFISRIYSERYLPTFSHLLIL